MEYQVSARKYRPGTFQDLIGQPHVVQTLKNAITNRRVAHAYLFSGMRGVGKTTVARILAKALNCERGPTDQPCERCESCIEITRGASVDVMEIDGASNTGVDDVRELRENIKFAPFRGRYRVYIIDEVHMLSNSAFNALLKTLEEPPAHAIFVFATTEIHKIPATILSRCQHFNFRRIPRLEIVSRLRHVAEQTQVTVDDRSLATIARASDGSMRDALSLFDQAVAFGGQTIQLGDLESMLGSVPEELVRGLIDAIIQKESPRAIDVVAQVLNRGYDLRAYCSAIVERIRNLMIAAVVPSHEHVQSLIDLPDEEVASTVKDAQAIPIAHLQALFSIFSQTEDRLRGTLHPRFAFEVAVIKATHLDAVAGTHSPSTSTMPPLPPSRPSPVQAQATKQTFQPASTPRPSPPTQSPKSSPSAGPQRATISPALRPKAEPGQPIVRPKAPPPKPEALRIAPASAIPCLSGMQWEQAVDQFIQEYPNIGTFLEVGTLVKIDGDQIVIGYPRTASVACSRIQKEENRMLVANKIRDIVGRAVQLRVVELGEKDAAGPSIGQVRAQRQAEDGQALVEEARAHPLIKQVAEIFAGEVVEARRISDEKEAQ